MLKLDMERLNNCVEKDARDIGRFKERSYIYYIVSQYLKKVPRISGRFIPPIYLKLSNQEILKTVLEFFESLDPEMYKQAKSIIMGQNEIKMNIYDKEQAEEVEKNEKPVPQSEKLKKSPLMQIEQDFIWYKEKGIEKEHRVKRGKARIFVPKEGSINDVYNSAHEISHSFDLNLENLHHRNDLLR